MRLDFKKWSLVIAVYLILVIQSSAQPFRYNEKVFAKVDTLIGVEYATAPWLNNPISLLAEYNVHDGESRTEERPLLMDIFLPNGDTLTKRPAIIFAHSGAFIWGSRQVDDMHAFCDSFAHRGYVTSTIDYRLGMGADVIKIFGVIISLNITEVHAKRALYRGIQDCRAAVRYLKYNAELYGIDTTRIYMVGSSAGGFLALHNNYIDKDEEIPVEVLQEPSLGGIDDIGISGTGSSLDAIASFWGAISDIEIIEDNPTPVFLVHGTGDNTVPFKKGIPLSGIVPPNLTVGFTMPETYGSYCIDTALTGKNVFHETYFVEGEGHEFYGVNTGDFPEDGSNQYWDTINHKLSDFLLDRFRPNADFDVEIDGLEISFVNQSSNDYLVEWNFGDGNISNALQPVYGYYEPGEYRVHLLIQNRNMASDTISKVIVVSDPVVASEINIENIRVYPNPVTSRINIAGIMSQYEVTVYDILGRQWLKFRNIENNIINTNNLEQGIYLLEIKSENFKIVRKFRKVD
ncbi:MAG: T9SS type A sorting domain-containing protein [Mariniphaga sp.]|nr:T9SS type A sorting domain-containing protein [Mariniphaga sp.]